MVKLGMKELLPSENFKKLRSKFHKNGNRSEVKHKCEWLKWIFATQKLHKNGNRSEVNHKYMKD